MRRFQRILTANGGRIARKVHRSHAVDDKLHKPQVSSTSGRVCWPTNHAIT